MGQGESILSRFQYDCDGRRTKKIGEDGIRQYVYDQTSLLLEYDEAGLQKAKYDYGSDRLISLTRADEGRRFFTFDGLRSVTNLTDDTGSPVASYHLDAWGNFRFPSELLASKNRFAFTGYLWDQETSLFFAKARFYDPEVGRFTSQDSFLGQVDDPPSLHRYFYANANPGRFIDPTGHSARDAWEWTKGFFGTAFTQTGRVAEAAVTTVVDAVVETPKVIADAAVMGFEAATGVDAGFAAISKTGMSTARRMGRGESAAAITQDTMIGIVKGATNAQMVEDQLVAYADYRTGNATLDQFEERMAVAGGKAGATAAMAKGAQKWYESAKAKVVVESRTQAPYYEPVANITPQAAALAEFASGAPEGAFGVGSTIAPVAGLAATQAAGVASSKRPPVYSTAFEMRLDPADIGTSRAVHFNRANAALESAMQADSELAAMMENLIPGVSDHVSQPGGRQVPPGWIWEHASTTTAHGEAGVMRLVPKAEHSPGSGFWRTLHPDPGARGGYSEWAIPAGAKPNRPRRP